MIISRNVNHPNNCTPPTRSYIGRHKSCNSLNKFVYILQFLCAIHGENSVVLSRLDVTNERNYVTHRSASTIRQRAIPPFQSHFPFFFPSFVTSSVQNNFLRGSS